MISEANMPKNVGRSSTAGGHSKPSAKFHKPETVKVNETAMPVNRRDLAKWRHKSKFRINPAALAKQARGPAVNVNGVKTNYFKDKLKRKEDVTKYAAEQAVRTEILRVEEEG